MQAYDHKSTHNWAIANFILNGEFVRTLQSTPHTPSKSRAHPNQDGIFPSVQVEPALLQGHLHCQLPNSKMCLKPVWRLEKKALARGAQHPL